MKDRLKYAQVEADSRRQLREWLVANHATSGPIWLVTGKKSAGERYLPYDDIVEELLCFGWIDSLPRALDQDRTMLLISPRKPGSNWSALNKQRVARLEEIGTIMPAGQATIDAARRDGSWDRLAQSDSGIAPDDLFAALVSADAGQQWHDFSLSVRKRALELLLSAKTPETRQRRLEKIVAATRNGSDPTAWTRKG